MQYEKGELTLPVIDKQNFELVNLNEPNFKNSQYMAL
jgi:hypothetical protein